MIIIGHWLNLSINFPHLSSRRAGTNGPEIFPWIRICAPFSKSDARITIRDPKESSSLINHLRIDNAAIHEGIDIDVATNHVTSNKSIIYYYVHSPNTRKTVIVAINRCEHIDFTNIKIDSTYTKSTYANLNLLAKNIRYIEITRSERLRNSQVQ